MSITAATVQASSPIHPLGEPSLPALPNVLLVEIAKNLTRSDMATVANLCTATREFRRDLKHLDLSVHPETAEMTLEDWKTAFRLHRTFNSIDFGGYEELSVEMRDILATALRAQTMKKVIISTPIDFDFDLDKFDPWYHIFRTLNHEILKRSTPSTLEHLDLTGVPRRPIQYIYEVQSLISRCPNLRILRLPPEENDFGHSWERGLDLVKCLGPNLELLGPNWAPIDDEMIAEITSQTRFDREKLKGCQLTFEDDAEKNTVEKRWELLRFLPLSEMTTIELQAYKGFNPRPADIQAQHKILSTEMVDHIAGQLKENKKLEVLNLTGLIPSENLVPSLVRLINSLESDQLRELTLITNLEGIPDLTLIKEALDAKLPSWKKIEKIQINDLTLNLLQPPVNA